MVLTPLSDNDIVIASEAIRGRDILKFLFVPNCVVTNLDGASGKRPNILRC